MLQLFVWFQYLGIAVIAIEILFILKQRCSKIQTFLLIEAIATLINNIGYLFELQAQSEEAALLAVKFAYVGKPLIVLSFFFFILEFYKVKYPSFIIPFMTVFHIGVCLLVFSCEKHTLFYSSMEFVDTGFAPHLEFGHGIAYYLYMLMLLVSLAAMFAIGIRRSRQTQNVRELIWCVSLSSIPLITAAGLIIYLSGLTQGYDSTMPACILANTIAMILVARYDLLDTITIAKESIIDELPDGILVLDVAEHILYANHIARELYPSLESGVQEQVVDELHDLSQNATRFHRNNAIYRISEKDVKLGNIVYGRLFIASNVTESYVHEKEMEAQTEIAESANRAKSAFLAKMSHEIRTPINAIIGMNEMILRESREEDIRGYAMDVSNSAKSLLGIVNDILDSSKIESGKMEIIPVNYELDSLLNDLVNMIEFKAQEKNLTFCVEIQPSLPIGLFGDDVRIRQILLNLLTNAVKYTPQGVITLSVTGTIEGEEALFHYEVKDTGIGIKEEDLPKLYQSFGRIEEQRNRLIEGTGLGMVIVSELLILMDSKINVKSEYGKGSAFYFDLRQKITNPAEIGNFAERRKLIGTEYTYTEKFTSPEAQILVVDDNDMNRKVFKGLLKKTGVQIDDVDSGMQCLKLIQEKHYDIIFMDHMMPVMNGVETLQKIKTTEHKCKNTPVIILTANAVEGAREQYLEDGFDAFLSKPILPDKLEKIIYDFLPKELLRPAEPAASDQKYPEPAKNIQKLQETPETLPLLEEFDWNYALAHMGDEALLKQTLIDTYYSLSLDAKELTDLAEGIQETEGLNLYRIKVHALKGTSAMVGALLLSKLARMLEVAAIEGNLERIERLHPILLEEIETHRKRLQILIPEQKKAPVTDPLTVKSNLYMLQECLKERDFDAADLLIKMLTTYSYEEALQQKIEELALQIMDLEADAAIEIAEQIYADL